MSSLTYQLDRQLAHVTRFTGRLKTRPRASRALAKSAAAIDLIARGVFYLWRNRRYLTALKLANMMLVNVQFRLKTERVIGRPYRMKIESTNICNTHCQLCPTGLGFEGRAKGKMSLDLFRKLVDRFRRTLFVLDLSMWGDPLIVPEIFEMIAHAHRRGVWTYVSSNLHAFKAPKGHAEALVRSGLDMLTCSLHGASQETFAIYQPGKDFQETVAKVRHILETRNRLGSLTPAVQLNFVVTRHNEHERAAFEKLAAELGCRAVFSQPSLNLRFIGREKNLHGVGLAPDILEKKTRQHLEQWLARDRDFVLKPYQDMLDGKSTRGDEYNGHKVMDCSWPWRASVINWDGTVSTCCGSWDGAEDMGNILDRPFGEIWNGTKYRMARRSFKRRLTDEQAAGNGCATCPGFML